MDGCWEQASSGFTIVWIVENHLAVGHRLAGQGEDEPPMGDHHQLVMVPPALRRGAEPLGADQDL